MAAELFEIFFYAAIAIAIFIRLHSILGRAAESGSQEQKSFAGFKLDKVIDIVQEEYDNSMKASDDEILNVISSASPQDVLSRIKHLATLDTSFVVKNFIKCAEAAYEAIINAFTNSDLKQLSTLVDGEMLKKFTSMIDERKARNEIQEAIVVSINECKIEDVVVTAKKASITVKIKSEQIIVIRDIGNNEIKHGNPDRPQKLEDKFTFTKKVGSADPVWLLSAVA